jgi:hypothetical protein
MQLEIIAKKLILKSFKIRFFFVLIEIFLDIDSIEIISWGNIVQIQSQWNFKKETINHFKVIFMKFYLKFDVSIILFCFDGGAAIRRRAIRCHHHIIQVFSFYYIR